jgi:hypothetical protein
LAHKLALSLAALGLCWTQPLPAEVPLSIAQYIVEPGEHVAGTALESFANEWWQWAYSMQQTQSPVRDQSGSYCGVNQEGPVWYLAGGFGSSKIERACSLPADKHIFFPVINMVYYAPPGSEASCEMVKRGAALNNSEFVYIRVALDGSELDQAQRFRLASKSCFNLFARVPKEFDAPSVDPSATDGYWIMLKPLPPGHHKLEFRAFYSRPGASYGDMVQNISYDLTVLSP